MMAVLRAVADLRSLRAVHPRPCCASSASSTAMDRGRARRWSGVWVQGSVQSPSRFQGRTSCIGRPAPDVCTFCWGQAVGGEDVGPTAAECRARSRQAVDELVSVVVEDLRTAEQGEAPGVEQVDWRSATARSGIGVRGGVRIVGSRCSAAVVHDDAGDVGDLVVLPHGAVHPQVDGAGRCRGWSGRRRTPEVFGWCWVRFATRNGFGPSARSTAALDVTARYRDSGASLWETITRSSPGLPMRYVLGR